MLGMEELRALLQEYESDEDAALESDCDVQSVVLTLGGSNANPNPNPKPRMLVRPVGEEAQQQG